jgi:hypothetical protein
VRAALGRYRLPSTEVLLLGPLSSAGAALLRRWRWAGWCQPIDPARGEQDRYVVYPLEPDGAVSSGAEARPLDNAFRLHLRP